MSPMLFFRWIPCLVLALAGGCSSGQPSGSDETTGAVPVADSGDTGGAVALPASPGSETPAGVVPAAPAGSPAAEAEKAKEPEKDGDSEAPKPPSRIEVDVEGLAAALQSPLATQVFAAGEYFRQIPVGQRREVLLQLSQHADPNVRGNVWRVFTTLATKEDLSVLSEAILSPYSDVRIAAFETMARFPNAETIDKLSKLLETPDDRGLATGLLSKIGPACESAVLPYATHADAEIRRAAWDILTAAGTRKSVQALEQLTTQPQYEKEEALKRALEQLRERLRKA